VYTAPKLRRPRVFNNGTDKFRPDHHRHAVVMRAGRFTIIAVIYFLLSIPAAGKPEYRYYSPYVPVDNPGTRRRLPLNIVTVSLRNYYYCVISAGTNNYRTPGL